MTKSNYRPAGLDSEGAKLWDQVTVLYQMRPDEMRLLEDACREIDLIELMQASLPKQRFTTRGSQGQIVAHPLLAEIRQHRLALASLMKQLKLTDLAVVEDGAKTESDTSTQARKAAISRWGRRG